MMETFPPRASGSVTPKFLGRVPTWILFGSLATVSLATTFTANHFVLTDDVYRRLLTNGGPLADVDAFLSIARQWEVIGYVTSPLSLAVRILLMALVVQLSLLWIECRPKLGTVFRAAVLAQFAILTGTVVQTAWLGSLPAAARTFDRIQAMPGTLGRLLAPAGPFSANLELLLNQLSLFHIGWAMVFAFALEKPGELGLRTAGGVVVSVGILIALGKWTLMLYLGALG